MKQVDQLMLRMQSEGKELLQHKTQHSRHPTAVGCLLAAQQVLPIMATARNPVDVAEVESQAAHVAAAFNCWRFSFGRMRVSMQAQQDAGVEAVVQVRDYRTSRCSPCRTLLVWPTAFKLRASRLLLCAAFEDHHKVEVGMGEWRNGDCSSNMSEPAAW